MQKSLYLLEATGDRRDRGAEIENALRERGAVLLGAGKFYVSGIKMPDRTSLFGLGAASEVILLPEIEEGYAITLGSSCTVSRLALFGAEGDFPCPEKVGSRHGIGFLGKQIPGVKGEDVTSVILSDLFIEKFSGGGITGLDTGYSTDASIAGANLRIRFCGAGLNLAHFSEYHKFTNVYCNHNLYGCINNGGNNVFTACSFDRNKIGFLMDNSQKQSHNFAHGSAVGCTFNHSDFNEGIGIMLLGVDAGFVFSACQMGGSKMIFEKCRGVIFANLNSCGVIPISVSGKGMVKFCDCVFAKPPEIDHDSEGDLIFSDCRDRYGEKMEFKN